MRRETSAKLLDQAERSRLGEFPLEDVLFNGVFREMANISELVELTDVCYHYRYILQIAGNRN